MTPRRSIPAPGARPGALAVVRALASANLRRVARDRLGLFFIVVLPLLVILFVRGQGGPDVLQVGLAILDDGPAAARLTDRLHGLDGVAVSEYPSVDTLSEQVRRGAVAGGLVIPDGYDDTLVAGGTATVEVLADPASGLPGALAGAVGLAVQTENARLAAARFATRQAGVDAETAERAAERIDVAPALTIEAQMAAATAGGEVGYADTAPSRNLVLFVFISSLVAGVALVDSRRLGVTRRTLAAPTGPGAILLGEAAGRFLIAAGQGLLVVVGAAVLFGASWGNPLAVLAVVALFSLVGTGAALLVGATFSDPEQATSVAPFLGIGLGMLGGCMWPLEIVPPVLQAVGRVTPHAWAVDALVEIVGRGGGIGDIAANWASSPSSPPPCSPSPAGASTTPSPTEECGGWSPCIMTAAPLLL